MRPVSIACAALALLAFPSAASAAGIAIKGDPGVVPDVVYDARSGEYNEPVIQAGTGGLPANEVWLVGDRVPVNAGPGCLPGSPIVCGGRVPKDWANIVVNLGDLEDLAHVSSFISDVTVNGGSGDDDVYADGRNATANGGAGDDELHIGADFETYGHGGAGNDGIAGAFFSYADHFYGEAGNDLLVPRATGPTVIEAYGGAGNDQLVKPGSRLGNPLLSGGGGEDVIVIEPDPYLPNKSGSARLDGGDDDDVISAPWGVNTVDAGRGADMIDVSDPGDPSAAPDTVTCGPGVDIAWADANDNVAADCEQRGTLPAPVLPGVSGALYAKSVLLS